MDGSHLNPVSHIQTAETNSTHRSEKPNPVSSIESLFPTADANELLKLIAQGHNPDDLCELINHSKKSA